MTTLETTPSRAETTSPVQPEKLTADFVYKDILSRLHELDTHTDYFYRDLGIRATEAVEYQVSGPHRYLVMDESVQVSGAFKSNGMEFAIARAVAANPDAKTVITSSAGNAASAIALAAARHGLEIIANVPVQVSPLKRDNLERQGVTVHALYPTVEDGLVNAAAQAKDSDGSLIFMHPYDNPDAIAGQAMVGRRLIDSLIAQQNAGTLDVYDDRILINVQVGGGSLLTGVACAVRDAKNKGLIGDNVIVQAVRPERNPDGTLNDKFDGLYVARPGKYAQAILPDKRFVQRHTTVSELDAGRAAHRLASFTYKRFEPAALVGAAVYEKAAADLTRPVVFVSIASGNNVTKEAYDYFRQATYRHQHQMLGELATANNAFNPGPALKKVSRTDFTAASPTAEYRAGLSGPPRKARTRPFGG